MGGCGCRVYVVGCILLSILRCIASTTASPWTASSFFRNRPETFWQALQRNTQRNAKPQRMSGIHRWLQLRCSDNDEACWFYNGHLTDPTTGERLARIQGLERCRLAVDEEQQPDGQHAEKPQQLHIRRLFCYRPVGMTDVIADEFATKEFAIQAGHKRQEQQSHIKGLLRSFRRRGKTAPIPQDQAISVYDRHVTIHGVGGGGAEQWWTSTDPVRNQTVHATVRMHAENDDEDDEWSVSLFGRQGTQRPQSQPPKRRPLIQLSLRSPASSHGVQETYHYRSRREEGPVTVRYNRYGEGPAWYGATGRWCCTDLVGRRLTAQELLAENNDNDVTWLLELTRSVCPDFWNDHNNSRVELQLPKGKTNRWGWRRRQ